jgi:hypothetical protein
VVTVRHFAAGQRPDSSGDADRLGGVGEVQASDGSCLQAAELHAVVAAVASVVLGWDVWPGQAGEQVVQGGLVGLDDQDVGGVLDAHQPGEFRQVRRVEAGALLGLAEGREALAVVALVGGQHRVGLGERQIAA